jgi:hypothetical protein
MSKKLSALYACDLCHFEERVEEDAQDQKAFHFPPGWGSVTLAGDAVCLNTEFHAGIACPSCCERVSEIFEKFMIERGQQVDQNILALRKRRNRRSL